MIPLEVVRDEETSFHRVYEWAGDSPQEEIVFVSTSNILTGYVDKGRTYCLFYTDVPGKVLIAEKLKKGCFVDVDLVCEDIKKVVS